VAKLIGNIFFRPYKSKLKSFEKDVGLVGLVLLYNDINCTFALKKVYLTY
jgi:hypothetical protein